MKLKKLLLVKKIKGKNKAGANSKYDFRMNSLGSNKHITVTTQQIATHTSTLLPLWFRNHDLTRLICPSHTVVI